MTYTAVIVEPRKHKALSFVLRNFLTNLSNEWNIILFHGLKNVEFVNNILKNDVTSEQLARISLENLNVDNLTRHTDRKSTRLNSSHVSDSQRSRMPSSA
jgi:ethanolamine utilization cobalamin adenosyltransferase